MQSACAGNSEVGSAQNSASMDSSTDDNGTPALQSATGGTAAPTGQLSLGLGTGLNVGFAPDGSLVTAGAVPGAAGMMVRRRFKPNLRAGLLDLGRSISQRCHGKNTVVTAILDTAALFVFARPSGCQHWLPAHGPMLTTEKCL